MLCMCHEFQPLAAATTPTRGATKVISASAPGWEFLNEGRSPCAPVADLGILDSELMALFPFLHVGLLPLLGLGGA